MRDLTPTENKNEFIVYDKPSDTVQKLYYRTITTPDLLRFKSKVAKTFETQDSEERLTEFYELQIDTALQFITGFAEGTYSYNGKEFSSDPESKNYDPGWKVKLKETIGDTLILFCEQLFGQSNIYVKKNSAFMKSYENMMKPGQKKSDNRSSATTGKTARRSRK